MNAKELKAELVKLSREISPTASVSFYLDGSGGVEAVFCSVYPFGHDYSKTSEENAYFNERGDDFAEVIAAIRATWAKQSDHMRRSRVHKMALAIIRITAEQGYCTDAALRREFSGGEVVTWGPEACQDANAIAQKGPFAIVTLGGDNGAPDQAPEGAVLQ